MVELKENVCTLTRKGHLDQRDYCHSLVFPLVLLSNKKKKCDQINEISFELQMETIILILMIFTVLSYYLSSGKRWAGIILG